MIGTALSFDCSDESHVSIYIFFYILFKVPSRQSFVVGIYGWGIRSQLFDRYRDRPDACNECYVILMHFLTFNSVLCRQLFFIECGRREKREVPKHYIAVLIYDRKNFTCFHFSHYLIYCSKYFFSKSAFISQYCEVIMFFIIIGKCYLATRFFNLNHTFHSKMYFSEFIHLLMLFLLHLKHSVYWNRIKVLSILN